MPRVAADSYVLSLGGVWSRSCGVTRVAMVSTWRALRIAVSFGVIAPGMVACGGDDMPATAAQHPAPRSELPESNEGAAKPTAAERMVRDPERLTTAPRAGATAPPAEARASVAPPDTAAPDTSVPDTAASDTAASDEVTAREPEVPQGTVSIVGEAYPLPEDEAAEEACVCPVEPSATEETVEMLRDWRAETRYRRPQGSAARVAGGPPEGFERPPPTAREHRPAIPGGFERPPASTDDPGAESQP